MNQNLFCLLLIAMNFSYWGCTNDKGKKIPDVSHIDPPLRIIRFDQELFQIDTNQITQGIQQLETKYPEFSNLYFSYILQYKDPKDTSKAYYDDIRGFLINKKIRELYDTCQVVFNDFSPIKRQFHQAFQFYTYHFPDRSIPSIYTLISEYAYQSFIFQEEPGVDGIGVGLDFFLGDQYPYRAYNPSNPNFSNYLIRSFNKDHLVKKTLESLLSDMIGKEPGNRLLDLMVHNGKRLYLLDQLLPYTADSIKLEYTQEQVEWCRQNEFNLWAHFISEDLLYSTSREDIQKLVSPSPSSPGMPPEAPGRTANWTGWQIVKKFMAAHPDTSLEELIALNDAQQILNKSKYKPRN